MTLFDKTRLLQRSILSGLVMSMSGMAYAQVEQFPIIDDEAFEENNETIVVTGSRIRRPDLDTVFPTTVINPETIDKAAFTNIADALSEIPGFGDGVNPSGVQGANIGTNFVDFLGLGEQRTLTVVNGRRFVSADVSGNGLSVDFNVIPLALVERVDIIGVGGAPIYGSDAIAGTINVILKDDFEGLEATALYGQTERGDADRRQFQIVAGANSEDGKSNVTFSAEYFKQDGLVQTARPKIFVDDPFLSEVPCGTLGFKDFDLNGDGECADIDPDKAGLQPDPEDAISRAFNLQGGSPLNVQLFSDGGTIGTAFGSGPLNQGNPGLNRLFLPTSGFGGLIFEDNGNLRNFETGTAIPGSSPFFAQGGEPYPFFAQARQIQSAVERINFGSTVKHDINKHITFKADAQIAQVKAEELVTQGGFQTFAFDETPNNGISGALQIPVTNPFLNDQARGVLADNGFSDEDVFFLSRFNNDLIDGGKRGSESTVWRIAAGLEGDFEAFGGREFHWDVHGVAGQASNETSSPLLNDTRFLNAIEAIRITADDADSAEAAGNNTFDPDLNRRPLEPGDIVCQVQRDLARIAVNDRVLSNTDYTTIRGIVSGSGVVNQTAEDVTACEPLNLFGDGNASPEALDYVSQRGIVTADIEQRIWSANITGQLFEIPAGWASFAAGYETRRESALFATGGAVEVGLGRNAAVPDTGGTFSTDEISGEIYIPLIAPKMEIPLIYNLEAEGSIRDISNDAAGDATVWTVGGSYSPIDMITFRGNKTRSVRAPSLTELFQPIVTQFDQADDPCDARFIADGDNAANRAANCASVGITQPFTSNIANASAQGLTGGNPNLLNETANAWTFGAIFQPDFVPGLTITGDYINIEIADLIGTRSVEQNLEACFDSDPTVFPNVDSCSSFTRAADGQIINFVSGQINADQAEYQFLNLRADYSFELADLLGVFRKGSASDLGELSLDANAFHVIERAVIVDGVAQDSTVGGFDDPRWSGTVDATYNNGAFRFFWRTLWQDRTLFSPSGNDTFADENNEIVRSVGGRFMHNASVSYDLSQLTETYDKPVIVQLNVDNVFDRTPGRGLREQFDSYGNSEILGRRYTLRVRAAF